MASFKSNILNRTEYRRKCRQKLSNHICEIVLSNHDRGFSDGAKVTKLGISIEPPEVRLITGADDQYFWQTLPGKQHFFTKYLSKHSDGAYKELCREVGVSFEVVRASERKPIKMSPKVRANFIL